MTTVSTPVRDDPQTAEALTFEDLYRDCAQSLYNFVLRSVRNPEDAHDICQEVWAKAYRQLATLREPRAARVWLYRIAKHDVIDTVRRRARRPQTAELGYEPPADHRDEPPRALIGKEQAAFAWQALAALQPRQQMALYLREVEDRCYREIAETLECTESAVETLLFRSRRRFAEQYGALAESRPTRCAQAHRMMTVRLDGEGSAIERRALEAHLDECAACGVTLRAARDGAAMRGALPLVAAPPLSGLPWFAEGVALGAEVARGLLARVLALFGAKTAAAASGAVAGGAILVAAISPVPDFHAIDRHHEPPVIVAPSADTMAADPRSADGPIAVQLGVAVSPSPGGQTGARNRAQVGFSAGAGGASLSLGSGAAVDAGAAINAWPLTEVLDANAQVEIQWDTVLPVTAGAPFERAASAVVDTVGATSSTVEQTVAAGSGLDDASGADTEPLLLAPQPAIESRVSPSTVDEDVGDALVGESLCGELERLARVSPTILSSCT